MGALRVREEVFRAEIDPPLPRCVDEAQLQFRRDDSVEAAARPRICPTPDPVLGSADHCGDRPYSAADLDDSFRRFRHVRIVVRTSHGVKCDFLRATMPRTVRIIQAMKVSEVTPEWIRLRARTKGWRLEALAKAIPMERTKLSKSLNGKRNFLGWELAKIVELLDDAPAHATDDPDLRALLEDYLALSESDRLRARALLRALLQSEALERTHEAHNAQSG